MVVNLTEQRGELGSNWQSQQSQLARENEQLKSRLNAGGTPFNANLAAKGPGGQLSSISQLMDWLLANQNAGYGEAKSAARKAGAASAAGFAGARTTLAGRGDQARTDILNRGKANSAMTQSRLIGSGLWDSTAGPGYADRMDATDLESNLARLDAALNEADSELQIRQGGAESAANLNLSQIAQNQTNATTSLGLNWADIVGGVTHQNDDASNAGTLIGTLLGGLF